MGDSILVVEDDEHVREIVGFTLRDAGYLVRTVTDGLSAVREVTSAPPDLLVLDIRLPGIDGWEVCHRVRQHSGVPILFLTALGEEEHVVRGLGMGGDDYLPKPFSPGILLARVQALLRRAAAPPAPVRFRLRGLTIDLASAEVRCEGRLAHLTPTEFRILAVLARRAGQVLSPREIMLVVHGYDLVDREAQELTKVHVRNLRHKIEPQPDKPRYVLTVRGMGYMLNADELEETT